MGEEPGDSREQAAASAAVVSRVLPVVPREVMGRMDVAAFLHSC